MATLEQIKALIESHAAGDGERFFAIATQIAAHAATHGHGKLAVEIRKVIENTRASTSLLSSKASGALAIRPELAGLVSAFEPKVLLNNIVLAQDVRRKIDRFLLEQRQQHKIRAYGLVPRHRLLLVGPPGTGKTLTASVIGGELHIPVYVIQFDSLITKYMGETAAKLRLVFDSIGKNRGVYLFDEFDAIGGKRNLSNDVGEIRRVLNSFLQMIDQDSSGSIIVAATNHPELLDRALMRRFDDCIEFGLPTSELTLKLLQIRLEGFQSTEYDWQSFVAQAEGLSHAEITRACDDAIKEALLRNEKHVSSALVTSALEDRKRSHT